MPPAVALAIFNAAASASADLNVAADPGAGAGGAAGSCACPATPTPTVNMTATIPIARMMSPRDAAANQAYAHRRDAALAIYITGRDPGRSSGACCWTGAAGLRAFATTRRYFVDRRPRHRFDDGKASRRRRSALIRSAAKDRNDDPR